MVWADLSGSIAMVNLAMHRVDLGLRSREQGGSRELAELGAGKFFGERALLMGDKATVSVVPKCTLKAYTLDRDTFMKIFGGPMDQLLADVVAKRDAEAAALRAAPSPHSVAAAEPATIPAPANAKNSLSTRALQKKLLLLLVAPNCRQGANSGCGGQNHQVGNSK